MNQIQISNFYINQPAFQHAPTDILVILRVKVVENVTLNVAPARAYETAKLVLTDTPF